MEDTFHMRAALSSKIVVGFLVGLPMSISLLAAFRHPSFWGPTALCALVACTLLAWLQSIRLSIQQNTLRYSSLFRQTRSLPLNQINHLEIQIGSQRYTDRFKPSYRLILVPKAQSQIEPLILNLKVFSPQDIRGLFAVLKAHDVPISDSTV